MCTEQDHLSGWKSPAPPSIMRAVPINSPMGPQAQEKGLEGTYHRGVRRHSRLGLRHLRGGGCITLVFSLLPAPSCLLFLLENKCWTCPPKCQHVPQSVGMTQKCHRGGLPGPALLRPTPLPAVQRTVRHRGARELSQALASHEPRVYLLPGCRHPRPLSQKPEAF